MEIFRIKLEWNVLIRVRRIYFLLLVVNKYCGLFILIIIVLNFRSKFGWCVFIKFEDDNWVVWVYDLNLLNFNFGMLCCEGCKGWF